MKYILVEDKDSLKYRFNLFAINNDIKYVFDKIFWSANVQDLLCNIHDTQLQKIDFFDDWLNCVVASFNELPTLSYIEQHYPELLI